MERNGLEPDAPWAERVEGSGTHGAGGTAPEMR